MHGKSFRFYLVMLFLLVLPLGACGPKYKAAKAEKQLEKRMDARKNEGDRAMQQGRHRHQNVQSPEVRQRMKETRRKSDRFINNNRKRPFYIRWYYKITGRR